jgi:ABC-2 type transport system ATP-binding protein
MGRRDVLEIMARLRGEQNTTIFYSTHILDDVQRVSDSVAILDRGRLLAQAPIEELLTIGGTGGAVYEITLRGESRAVLEQARTRVRSQGWVSSLDESSEPGAGRRWVVRATDQSAAEENLLRLVLQTRGVRVTGYGRKLQSLEEAFFDLIEKGGGVEA